MKRIFWSIITALAFVAIYTILYRPDIMVMGLSSKCYMNCTNPTANYYDQYGNEFNYLGTLLKANCSPQPAINGTNPECTCPAGSYQQGLDKNTGAFVCNSIPNPDCPYAEAQPLNSPVCQKLTQQANQQIQQMNQQDQPPAGQTFEGK